MPRTAGSTQPDRSGGAFAARPGDVDGGEDPYEKGMKQLSQTLADLVETHGASVVRLKAGCRGGTGVGWSERRVVTAAHLVDERPRIGLPDGRTVDARVVGLDRATDIALLEVDADVTPAPFADLSQSQVGHLTVSLARPGKSVRAALGMIGTLGREPFRTRAGGRIDAWLQPDGGVPHGFSGSALLDAEGRALGINTTGLVRGVGLTIPTATLRRVLDQLAQHGRVRRGYLGVGVVPVELADQKAVVVVGLEPGGPAEKAGLAIGDVVLAIDGAKVASPRALAELLEGKVDAELGVSILRGGNPLELRITAGARP